MNMEGFKPFDFSEGIPTLSVTENGVTFNKSTTSALDYAEYIKVYISRDKKQIFVTPGIRGEVGVVKYYTEGRKAKSVRINHDSFVAASFGLCGFKYDYGCRVQGQSVDGGVLFDFKNAKPIK